VTVIGSAPVRAGCHPPHRRNRRSKRERTADETSGDTVR
jgi:hypothetical protein